MLCFVAPKRLAGYGFSSAPNQRVQDCDICPGSRKLLNPYQAISLLRSQIRLVPAARMRLWSNSSQDEGGELGVWLRVRTLKSAAFNLRTRVLGNQFQVIDLGKYTADRATKVAGSCGRPGFSVTLGGSVKNIPIVIYHYFSWQQIALRAIWFQSVACRRRTFTAVTRVQIPSGTPKNQQLSGVLAVIPTTLHNNSQNHACPTLPVRMIRSTKAACAWRFGVSKACV
jgi:hypothetical protein